MGRCACVKCHKELRRGVEVVDAIAKVETTAKRGGEGVMENVPVKPITILSIARKTKS